METIDLGGKWKAHDTEQEFAFEGEVPGTVAGDLVNSGLMPHPYQGTNEQLFQRLESKSWVYQRTFFLKKLEPHLNYQLVLKGVDTLSRIYLNQHFVGKTENMFLEYRFEVKPFLRQGENQLKVEILSPISLPQAYQRNSGSLRAAFEPARVYLRKAQYSYGWDWGARIATGGIWRAIQLEVYPDGRLFGSTAYLEDLTGKVKFSGYVELPPGEDPSSYRVEVLLNEGPVGTFPVEAQVTGYQFEGTKTIEHLSLWYPRGLGESTLYQIDFRLLKQQTEVWREQKRTGFRTVRLLRETDGAGESFIFEINRKKVFAKGANWIPAENILSWLKKEDYQKLLEMAKDAQLNMLRVWGGGIYEDPAFYSRCDELGIMVWQDFMFACGEYPDHLDWFRKLAGEEVRQNLIKLRHHPSIVLWCGNNENNWGFEEWDYQTKVEGKHLGNRLYLEDFPQICSQEDPARPYWPSSPWGGSRANSSEAGDKHEWRVWSQWQDYSHYTEDQSKFVSEFGFQSAPHPKTIDFFAQQEDKNLFSPVMLIHNKQTEGPERIMKFIHQHFGLVSDFDSITYLSQLNQAEAIKTGVEHWRTRKYQTAGTLYWQWNDSWPVFSWSAIDYFKRPKALYYYTRRFYAPLLPIAKRIGDELVIFIINDGESCKLSLEYELWTLAGKEVKKMTYQNLTVPADSVVQVDRLKVSPSLLEKSIAYLKLKEGTKLKAENHELLANLRWNPPANPQISFRTEGEHWLITSQKPALGVKIETESSPEDNFFVLVPSTSKRIKKVGDQIQLVSAYDYFFR